MFIMLRYIEIMQKFKKADRKFLVEVTVMNKGLSLLFAAASTFMLVATGVALSYRSLALAGVCLAASILIAGCGFMVKAKFRR